MRPRFATRARRSAAGFARRHRRGIAAVLVALLLPVFVGFVALSVDTAVVASARAQMSTAADAAALAAAQQLATDRRVQLPTNLSPEVTAANSQAVAFAAANKVLGTGPAVSAGTLTSTTGDVVFGYINPADTTNTLQSAAANLANVNSARVTITRSSDKNGVVPGFFSSLMGFRGSTVTVSSTATAWVYKIAGFKNWNSNSAAMLPIVLDVTTYQAMIAGQTTDLYSYDPVTKTVSDGPDGVTESKLYPVASGSPGNWGTIKVGVSNNSTSVLGAQIRYGITPDQLATFPGGKISLDTSLTPPSITFQGNPGISAGIKDDLASIIGKPVSIPIYDINGGNGNNAWYRVIDFAPARIVSVNFQGNPKYVIIQPAVLNDPTIVHGGAQTSWSSGGQVVLHLTK